MSAIHLITYTSILFFIIMILSRGIRIARMPVHLRWELYPVPHEKGRASYGGSRLEEVDWWTKPAEKDHFGELGVMIPEILFLKGVWEHNRPLWFGSFTLHFGLYLLIGNMGLLILAAILDAAGFAITADTIPGNILFPVVTVLTYAGCITGAVGSIVMFIKRTTDKDLAPFSTASHYFNLIALAAIYFSGMFWVVRDSAYASNVFGLYSGIFTASAIPELPAVALWAFGVSLFFLIYLPLTHMTHFFTKYFTYHTVRWEDTPNLPGGSIQPIINQQLGQTVTWSAEHIGADGKKNWVDLATTNPFAEKESKEGGK